MQAFTHRPPQCRILRAFGNNPLVRIGDRLEAAIIVVAVAISLAAAPVAAAVGTEVHHTRSGEYAQQARTRTNVSAIVTGSQDSSSLARRYTPTPNIYIRWSAEGLERTDTITSHRLVKAGDQVDIWVDPHGSRVDPPRPSSQAAVDAVSTALTIWLGVVAGALATVALLRWQINRHHAAGWEREIKSLADNQQPL
jgi:hypothetical protein